MPDTDSRYTDPVLAKNRVTPPSTPDDDDHEISLKPMFEVLWAYGQTLRNGVLIAAAAVAVLFIASSFLVPADRFGTLHFRVLFEGADQGKYPNGTPFSSSEIVATPVLDQVYKANDLQRYMQFTDLKESMFALESNPDLELLSYEYQGKLSDTKLTPVDRARIEAEFRKKLESLKSAEFSLNLRRSERMKKLPASLVTKILDDTLSEWARQAREQKGALQYDIPVFSSNILQRDVVRNDDYIIAVDILRTKVSKILTNIDQVSKVPGAALMRTGKTRLSLAEIRSNLEDLLRFDIEPSISLITSARLTRDPQQARMYIQDQLRQIVLSRAASLQRMKAIQEPLRDYVAQSAGRQAAPAGGGQPGGAQAPLNTPALIPQLGESFLQQIVDMSTQNNDAKYRQELTDRVIDEGLQVASNEREKAYYEALNSSLSGWVKSPGESVESKALVARLDKSFQAVATSLDDVVAIYDELSSKNLNPGTMLYAVTAPATVHTERSISLRTLALFAILAFVCSVVALVVGCLAHNYYRSEIAAHAPETAAPHPEQHEIV